MFHVIKCIIGTSNGHNNTFGGLRRAKEGSRISQLGPLMREGTPDVRAARAFLAEYPQPSPLFSARAAVSAVRAAVPPARMAMGSVHAVGCAIWQSENIVNSSPFSRHSQGLVQSITLQRPVK